MNAGPWPAPAKLNLFLHVTGRRPDGYHLIQTLFQLIDLADEIRFTPRTDGEVRRLDGPAGVPADSDLCVRAARRLREAAGRPDCGVDIRLSKRIPVQGGLGGGSSDAATTLVALNEIWGLRLPPGRLAELGLAIGADVPLFVRGETAWGEGIGERLTPVELPPRHFAIVFPGVGMPTAEVFQAPELTRKTPETTIRGFLKAGGRNDCEPVVTGRSPEVRRALAWLAERGEARMTGTGSCVFAAFADRDAAAAALAGLPPEWRGFVAQGLDRSPLQERLAAERSRVSGKV
ncbi:MAG TPA: 4-(cytidine 5'-diphospho)-2-C-methyl-D-erythritol kinase [Steroidobacteraceae bacterium]|nr:4-(cytidine 5'-diphospho)-2-C-methyl-D-erythritol kinase [Steroidobacteraceae bacterium]